MNCSTSLKIGEGGNPDAEIDVPPQDHFHDERHGVHVDAAHQDRHERETNRGKHAAGFAKTQFQVAGHGVRLGDVVERHHHQAEEQHGRDGADPVPVRREDSVLIGRRGPAHEFEGAQICGKKAEAGDPRRHFATGEEEILARVGAAFQVEADGQHQHEIKDHNHQIHRRQMHQAISGDRRHAQIHHSFSAYLRAGRGFRLF
jgi:hypothetical protein